jgi:hypothetical protein
MPEIIGKDKLISITPRKKLGKHREYGRSLLANSEYGDEHIFIESPSYGVKIYGKGTYGDRIRLTGIYRIDSQMGIRKYYNEPYYIPKNPRTEEQQNQRAKMTAAVAEWQDLTDEQKSAYNKKAKFLQMSGYNYFLKQYLLSN